jgi:hypothetical protein
MNSLSLNQGAAFIKNQENTLSKKKTIKKSSIVNIASWLPDPFQEGPFQEGATTMGAVSLEGSNEAQKSNAVLSKTEVTDQMAAELVKLNAQYKTAVQATSDAQNKYNAGMTDYISRTNSIINKNSNKNVKLSDGTIGYMTNRGVFEQYDDISKTAGINGCPIGSSFNSLNFSLGDIDKHPGVISLGPNKPIGSACGNEGSNIYVNSVLADADVKYLGCYTNVPGAMTAIPNIDNYDDCKLYAMNKGYKYFGLVNANITTQRVTCVVGNDKAKITSKGLGYIFNEKVLFTLSSKGSMSALLTNEGQIVLLSATNGTGKVGARMPSNVAKNCQQGGTIRVDNATYGGNCNSLTNTTTNRVCQARFGNICLKWANTSTQTPRFPNVPVNNAKGKLTELIKDGTSKSQYSPVTTIVSDYVGKGLSLFTTGVNSWIFGQSASGCSKNFSGNYYCGATSKPLNASDYGSITMNCNDVIATCQFFLILQDDGNMCIYRGTSPTDNKGLIWQSGTTGKQFKRGNPKSIARLGKYGRNYMRFGEYLNATEWIGSTNGSMKLMMKSDGNLVLSTSETYNSWVTLKNGKIASINPDFTAVYELSKVGKPGNLGKMGHIDDNGVLSEYPDKMIGVGVGYTTFKSINSPTDDLSGMPLMNKTPESCQLECDNNLKCFGYVYDRTNRICRLKDKNVLQSNKYNTLHTDFYLRNTKVIGANSSCDVPVINVDSTSWSNYQQSKTQMTSNTLCSKFAYVGEMPVLAFKKEFEDKKKISDDLAAKIDNMNKVLQARRGSQNVQTKTNTTNDLTNNVVYNQTMDAKIPKAVEVTINSAPKKEPFENMDDMNSPSQRTTTVRFKNIDAIVEDSNLVAIQQNYNYVLWCILAVMTGVVVAKTLRKSQ